MCKVDNGRLSDNINNNNNRRGIDDRVCDMMDIRNEETDDDQC